jgi:hypothetical protein
VKWLGELWHLLVNFVELLVLSSSHSGTVVSASPPLGKCLVSVKTNVRVASSP